MTARRITLVVDIAESVSDNDAIEEIRDLISDGENLHWYLQDLPALDNGRWVEF